MGEAAGLLSNWTTAWRRFGWLPEMFEMSLDHRHPTLTGAGLRQLLLLRLLRRLLLCRLLSRLRLMTPALPRPLC